MCSPVGGPFPASCMWHSVLLKFAVQLTLLQIVSVRADPTTSDFLAKNPAQSCGPVPSNEEMAKVADVNCDVLEICLPVLEKNGLKMSDLLITAERICAYFDSCIPNGVISSREPDNPEIACFEEKSEGAISRALLDCVFLKIPLDKKSAFGTIHWFLALIKTVP